MICPATSGEKPNIKPVANIVNAIIHKLSVSPKTKAKAKNMAVMGLTLGRATSHKRKTQAKAVSTAIRAVR